MFTHSSLGDTVVRHIAGSLVLVVGVAVGVGGGRIVLVVGVAVGVGGGRVALVVGVALGASAIDGGIVLVVGVTDSMQLPTTISR